AMRAAEEFAIERGKVEGHRWTTLRPSNRGRQMSGAVLTSMVVRSERQMPLVAIGARLRAICLALPEANEVLMRRGPSYRVADKIFALERPRENGLALWCK